MNKQPSFWCKLSLLAVLLASTTSFAAEGIPYESLEQRRGGNGKVRQLLHVMIPKLTNDQLIIEFEHFEKVDSRLCSDHAQKKYLKYLGALEEELLKRPSVQEEARIKAEEDERINGLYALYKTEQGPGINDFVTVRVPFDSIEAKRLMQSPPTISSRGTTLCRLYFPSWPESQKNLNKVDLPS